MPDLCFYKDVYVNSLFFGWFCLVCLATYQQHLKGFVFPKLKSQLDKYFKFIQHPDIKYMKI